MTNTSLPEMRSWRRIARTLRWTLGPRRRPGRDGPRHGRLVALVALVLAATGGSVLAAGSAFADPSTTTTVLSGPAAIDLPATGIFYVEVSSGSSPVTSGTVTFSAKALGATEGFVLCSDVSIDPPGQANCETSPNTFFNATLDYWITATFSGPGYGSSTSAPLLLAVEQAPTVTGGGGGAGLDKTTTTLTGSSLIALPDQGSFSATVTDAAGPVTNGTVSFSATDSSGSSITLCSAVTVSSAGTATCTPAAGSWPAVGGPFSVTAAYSGDSSDGSSSSLPLALNVNPAANTPWTEVYWDGGLIDLFLPGTTTFTVTVTDASSVVQTGSVTFQATAPSGTVITLCSDAPVNSSGEASCETTPSTFPNATVDYSMSATYSGPGYGTSSAPPSFLDVEAASTTTGGGSGGVTLAPTTTDISGPSSITLPAQGSFSASVTDGSGPVTGGSVSFQATGPSNKTVILCSGVLLSASGSASCAPAAGTWPASGGSYSVVATYSGDGTDATSSSTPLALRVTPAGSSASTSTTLSGPDRIALPATGTFTSTTTSDGAPVSSGEVSFSATGGGQTISLCSDVPVDSSGEASCATTPSSFPDQTVEYSLTASFSGSGYGPSTSPVLYVGVVKKPITTGGGTGGVTLIGTTTVLSAPSQVALPDQGSFSATVTQSGGVVTGGSVSFVAFGGSGSRVILCGGVTLGSDGTATCVPPAGTWPAAGGTYTVYAGYSGTSTYDGSLSAGASVVVVPAPAATTTTVSGPSHISLPDQGSFSATVTDASGPVRGGSVSFQATGPSNKAVTLCSDVAVDSSGKANCTPAAGTWAASGGSYSVVASYSGDATDASSTSEPFALVVAPAVLSTTTTLSGPSSLGYPPSGSFSAIVTDASGPVTGGSVSFQATGPSGKVITLCSDVAVDSSGEASCTPVPSSWPAEGGSYSVVAVYSGDTGDAGSSSSVLSVSVASSPVPSPPAPTPTPVQVQVPTTVPVPPSAGSSAAATTTAVRLESPAAYAGTTAGLRADVSSQAGVVSSGRVRFSWTAAGRTHVLCSVSVVDGVAHCPVNLGAGSYLVTAAYLGTSGFSASSGTTTLVVDKAPVTLALSSSPATPDYGEPVTISVGIDSSSELAPAGEVRIDTMSGTPLCQAVPVVADEASCVTSALDVGNIGVVAAYSGDAEHRGATATTAVRVGVDPSETSLVATPAQTSAGQPVELVAVASGLTGPVGAGEITISGPEGVLCAGRVDANGTLRCSSNELPAGTDRLVADYGGDALTGPSTASATVVVATPTVSGQHPSTGGGSGQAPNGPSGGGGGQVPNGPSGGGSKTTQPVHHHHHKARPVVVHLPKKVVRTTTTTPPVPVVTHVPAPKPVAVSPAPVAARLLTTTVLKASRRARDTVLTSQTFAHGQPVTGGSVTFVAPNGALLCAGVSVGPGGVARCVAYGLGPGAIRVVARYHPVGHYLASAATTLLGPLHRAVAHRGGSHSPVPVPAPRRSVTRTVTSCPVSAYPRTVTAWVRTYVEKDVFFWLLCGLIGLALFFQRARRSRRRQPADESAALVAARYEGEK